MSDPSLEITQHIASNHMDMCRFKGIDDPEFKKASAAITRIMAKVFQFGHRSSLATRGLAVMRPPPLSKERILDIFQSLDFAKSGDRRTSIKAPQENTCRWLLINTEYLSWLDPTQAASHRGLLWIKGKPGSGKSTLMKFALIEVTNSMPGCTIIFFFFNARGDVLEKTTIGLYRSILVQLLTKHKDLLSVLDYAPNVGEWTDDILKDLLREAIRELGNYRVVCFVDALDECHENQVRDMISFFGQLGRLHGLHHPPRFSVCLSSRHYPHITIPAGLQLTLEDQKEHGQDIANYIETELRIGSTSRSDKIRTEILRKASGTFMWVVLVVHILNREYDKGRVHLLRSRLTEIPRTLNDLFKDIVTRDTEDPDDLLFCIQLTLLSKRPLELEEIYFAMLSRLSRQEYDEIDVDDISSQDMDRFIVNASKGLVENTRARTVQFIHETVRDFLFNSQATASIWPELSDNFVGHGHESLKKACLTTMQLALARDSVTPRIANALDARVSFPFLFYAIENVLHHANEAQFAGITQTQFLLAFPMTQWMTLRRLLFGRHEDKPENDCLESSSDALQQVLADRNSTKLLEAYPLKTPSDDEMPSTHKETGSSDDSGTKT